jgi:nucleoside phosphorylase
MPSLDPANYHVAWIAPLWIEHVAAINMLDDQHDGSFPHREGRKYQVTAGKIQENNVIIATLHGEYGNVTVADLASEIRNRFPRLQLCLLVGVAAGLPLLPDRDIRLGDVLVAVPSQHDAGMVAYNLGKATPDGFFELRTLAQADSLVRSTITMVRAEWEGSRSRPDLAQKTKFLSHYHAIKNWKHGVNVKGYPDDFACPGQELDNGPVVAMALSGIAGGASSATASTGDRIATDTRDRSFGDYNHHPTTEERTSVWYGSIGTGDELIKDASRSAQLRAKHDIIGLEMEAYGAMTGLRVGVIRGVCDYANEEKNKLWQPYAAARAAAFAKTVIIRAGDLNPNSKKGTINDR